MKPKAVFLVEAANAIGAATNVLKFFEREPVPRDGMDFEPFVDAMIGLCRDHRRDCAGIADMGIVTGLFDALRLHRPISDDELQTGIESAPRLRRWLRRTFPDARSRPDQN